MASPTLQGNHYVCQGFGCYFFSFSQLAYFKVLTKDAPHYAVSEEYGSRTFRSYENALFAEMGTVAGHNGVRACTAKAPFSRHAVHFAMVGAGIAAAKAAFKLLNPGPQLAGTV